jgi:predicted glycoside hydrolase/deacetylase ChbG (UPF0249 family)
VSERVLVVNADDFGRSDGVNAGVVDTHERGIVTSTSLMVRWPAARQAAAYARRTPALAVGLHVDLGEWRYDGDEWTPRYEVVDGDSEAEVRAEVVRQLEQYQQLCGHPPTHLDSHQHVHREAPLRDVLLATAARLGVPLRHFTPGITYEGAFYGEDNRGAANAGAVTPEALVGLIEGLRPGVTELCCHPASADDHETDYAAPRLAEHAALCDPRVREAIARGGVTLRSFGQL